jgi:hypothetical protein
MRLLASFHCNRYHRKDHFMEKWQEYYMIKYEEVGNLFKAKCKVSGRSFLKYNIRRKQMTKCCDHFFHPFTNVFTTLYKSLVKFICQTKLPIRRLSLDKQIK